jgi:hypothetical protein
MVAPKAAGPSSVEQRLIDLEIELPVAPRPFGIYVEAVQTGNLLFLTGMLPTEERDAKFVGRIGAELDAQARRRVWRRSTRSRSRASISALSIE